MAGPDPVPPVPPQPANDDPTTDEHRDLMVENALLRGSLFLAARALKDYHDARHTTTDGGLQLTIPQSLRIRAGDAVARAERLLDDPDQKSHVAR